MENVRKFSIVVGSLGILALIFAVPYEHANHPVLGYIKYSLSAGGDFAFAVFANWLLKTPRMNDAQKADVSEKFSLVFGFINILWGNFAMSISLLEKGSRNSLILLIILAILTVMMYYPVHHYFIMFAAGCLMMGATFLYHASFTLDITSFLCSIFLMVMLFNLGVSKYEHGRDEFETNRKNIELMNETESQNEELVAGNQELIATNQELIATNEELNATTERLEEALGQMERASQAQKMFTNSMNHELRAPLNGIIGNLQVMLMDKDQPADKISELEECMSISKSMLGIVNDLLDFAKMDAGKLKIIPQEFDLHDVINDIRGMFENQARSKGLDFTIDIYDDMVCGLYGDDKRIQQILTNIVSNAVKYTSEGYVRINAEHNNGRLIFKVSDSGQGMSEESIKDLFTPFKRIAEAKNKKIQGTGLGMAIVKQLLELMNGTVDVESAPGKGTTFTISVPVEVSDETNLWKHKAGASNAGTPNAGDQAEQGEAVTGAEKIQAVNEFDGLKILYIDDTELNLTIIKKLLSDTGAEVTCLSDPREGLAAACSNKYDLMLIDHKMPDMDGPELYSAIKEQSLVNASVPAIIFTGNAGEGLAEEYTKMGFSGYLLKPVLKPDLLKIIRDNKNR